MTGEPAIVALFVPDGREISTILRAHTYLDAGHRPSVYAFQRDRYNRGFEPRWPQVLFGKTADADYGGRLKALLGAIPTLIENGAELRRARLLHARNIDQLALAWLARLLFNRRAPLVYEVLDIAEVMTDPSPKGGLFRALERFLLKRTQLLIVSSEGFIENYFRPVQRLRAPWLLLENKVHPAALAPDGRERLAAARAALRPADPRFRWRVGCFGLIRGRRTFETILALAERLPEVEFQFRGVLTTVDRGDFFEALWARPNVTYHGPYESPQDLMQIYPQVDFVWSVDLENDHNSRWLMPCRFYEGGLFGVPQLAAAGTEVGRRVAELGSGWVFPPDYVEPIAAFLAALTPEEHRRKRERILALPLDSFLAGSDWRALAAKLDFIGRRRLCAGRRRSARFAPSAPRR